MAKLAFVPPAPGHETAVMEFRAGFLKGGEKAINGGCGLERYPDYRKWLTWLEQVRAGASQYPATECVLALRKDGAVAGILSLRPGLTSEEARKWGHIGYAVAPALRNRGYAGQMLAWGVDRLAEHGLKEVAACCYASNLPSCRVLEKAGFAPDGGYPEEGSGKPVVRYKKRFI